MKKENSVYVILVVIVVVALDAFVWFEIVHAQATTSPQAYFFDVGEGDSELLVLPDGVKVLIDAGPDRSVVRDIENVLPSTDRYIDLAVITHPQLDHFGGFNYLLERFHIGAFLVNGRSADGAQEEWDTLLATIRAEQTPLVVVGEGDAVRYKENEIRILSPGKDFVQSAELNDTGIVAFAKTSLFRALFTADTGLNVEAYLAEHFDLHADILKVAHHGSKYATGDAFLTAVAPKLAVVEVGADNSYGHPTAETLQRLKAHNVAVFRTDQSGTLHVTAENGKLQVFAEK